jgi:hypothetical protein
MCFVGHSVNDIDGHANGQRRNGNGQWRDAGLLDSRMVRVGQKNV